jgi:hemoglobin-like flavoprotein
MGGAVSTRVGDNDDLNLNASYDIINMQEKFSKATSSIPMEVCVAHYTPSTFPLIPIVSKKRSDLCNSSWSHIIEQQEGNDQGGITSGMTLFYSEFYERLDILDGSGKFEAVLSRHSPVQNKIANKGAILIRIVKFILSIDSSDQRVQFMLYMLGKSHSQKGIRPWQYSVFVQTLLLTISSRLGTHATLEVMEAWVHLFAFVMKSMLPPAIKGQILETELSINTSSEFEKGKVAQEVAASEILKDLKKRNLDKNSSGANSSLSRPTPRIPNARSYDMEESRGPSQVFGPDMNQVIEIENSMV